MGWDDQLFKPLVAGVTDWSLMEIKTRRRWWTTCNIFMYQVLFHVSEAHLYLLPSGEFVCSWSHVILKLDFFFLRRKIVLNLK
jgi:hypothetical protein